MLATILICTTRVNPRLHMTLECLKNQTFKDFELIYVDAIKDKRPPEFSELIESYRKYYPIRYIQDKPRPNLGSFPGIANARNSGLIYAQGETIIMCGDHTWMPEYWIDRHIALYKSSVSDLKVPYGPSESGTINSAGPCYVIYEEKEPLENFKTCEISKHPEFPMKMYLKFGENTYEGPMDCRLPGIPEEQIFSKNNLIVSPGGYYHSHNLQVSLEYLLRVNGFDEGYDKESYGFEDCDLGVRLSYMGFPLMMDPYNYIVEIYDDKNYSLTEKMKVKGDKNKERYDSLLKPNPIWVNPSFDLRKLREKVKE